MTEAGLCSVAMAPWDVSPALQSQSCRRHPQVCPAASHLLSTGANTAESLEQAGPLLKWGPSRGPNRPEGFGVKLAGLPRLLVVPADTLPPWVGSGEAQLETQEADELPPSPADPRPPPLPHTSREGFQVLNVRSLPQNLRPSLTSRGAEGCEARR